MKRIREVNIVFLITVITAVIGSVLLPYVIKDVWVSLVAAQLILVLPSAIYLIFNKIDIKDSIRFKGVSFNNIILLVLLSFLLFPIISFINAISMLFVTNVIEDVVGSITNEVPYVMGISVIALIPAIFEETVYRGVFYNQYSKKNTLKGIFLSALLFGCLHMNFNQLLYAFVLGAVFVLIVEATDSIISSMIVHFVINGSSATLLYLMPKIEKFYSEIYGEEPTQGLFDSQALQNSDIVSMLGRLFIAAAISGILAFVVYRAIANNCGRYENIKNIFRKKDKTQDEGRFIDVPLGIGIGACVIIAVLVEVLPIM